MKKLLALILALTMLVAVFAACGDGHPIEIMDLSFAMQFLAMKYLLDHKGAMENKLYVLPEELNTEIAALKLQAMGAGIDTLSDEQKAYLAAE